MKLCPIVLIISTTLLEIVSSTPYWYYDMDGDRYLIDLEKEYNWHEAMHECSRWGAQLVSIENEEKMSRLTFLLDIIDRQGTHLWIGGHDQLSQSTSRPIYWSATGQELTYANWYPGNPSNNNGNEHCIHLLPARQWNDYPCTGRMGFLCEEKCQG